MNCYECIHYDACCDMGDAGVCYLKLHSDCEHFKSEYDFMVVEAIRCRACKYSKIHTCAITGTETLFCDYGEKPVAVEPTHYCGYGERRKNE